MKIDVLNKNTEKSILDRLDKIDENLTPKWGKMNATEVMKHLRLGLETPLQRLQLGKPNFLIKLFFGKKIKQAITNDELYGKNLPTAPDFIVHKKNEHLKFQDEKEKLIKTINDFVKHEDEKLDAFNHPFFGKMTAHEWRKSQWKHFNHHLIQFGV